MLCGVRMELLAFNTRNENEKTLLNAAGILRKEINDLNDTLPWPPSPDDLSVDKFKIPQLLETFLRTLLTGKFTETTSTRVNRLTLSYAQDFIYAVSRGRIKTPKCFLLPHTIKTLTNNTEILHLICRLGHGASYTLIEELDTENAYQLIEKQDQSDIILPNGVQKEVFTMVVADNIDRREETLSGTNQDKMFFPLCLNRFLSFC